MVASSLYGAFLDGRLAGVRVLVITYDASVFGWGAVLRATHEDRGHVIVGGFRVALDLLGEAYLEPSTAPDDPAAQVHREALAGLLEEATSALDDALNCMESARDDADNAVNG